MSALDPTTIALTLTSVVSILAGLIYKMLIDRNTELKAQNDRLQDRLARELDLGRTYTDLLNRILVIVEALRYEGRLVQDVLPQRRRPHSEDEDRDRAQDKGHREPTGSDSDEGGRM